MAEQEVEDVVGDVGVFVVGPVGCHLRGDAGEFADHAGAGDAELAVHARRERDGVDGELHERHEVVADELDAGGVAGPVQMQVEDR